MESLKTLKSTGRGRGVRGRWRNYRNNATIRGEIWRLLALQMPSDGHALSNLPPRGTSHTCPHCGTPAKTYRSPGERAAAVTWGRWLWCEACGFNGDRDYCASLNIARLGVALSHPNETNWQERTLARSLTHESSLCRIPAQVRRCCCRRRADSPPDTVGERSVMPLVGLVRCYLQSSQPKAVFLRLCG